MAVSMGFERASPTRHPLWCYTRMSWAVKKTKYQKEKCAFSSIQVGFGNNRRVSLCQESSPRVEKQSFPAPASLFLKERQEQTGSFPKQTDVNHTRVWISKFDSKWDQCRQGNFFQIGPSSTEISPQIVFATPVAMLVERRKPHCQERRKNSSDQVTHAAKTLPNMTTSAEKRPRPGKVLKEPKIKVSSFFSQYLIKKKGKGLVENTAHYREFLHCSPEEFTPFQHWF